MSKKRQSLMLSPAVKEMLDSIKNDDKNADALAIYLYSLLDFKKEPRGATKVEIQLKKMLYQGHEVAITAYELMKYTGVNYNICKEIADLYLAEIEEHNKSL